MRRLLLLGAILLGLAGTAQARITAGRALDGAAAMLTLPAAPCPAGLPVQTITVVNQAHIRPFALARVERAVTDQSMQLRAAWGTPCVQFAPGGWPLSLLVGATEWGVHYGYPFIYGDIYTDGLRYIAWSQVFSHEVVEMLVDPDGTGASGQPTGRDYVMNGVASPLEVADPVGERGYRLDGVWVSDFVLPAWYAGAASLPCATVVDPTTGAQSVQCGPAIAPAGAAAPYDEMGILTAPWQTTWERPGS